MVEAALRLDTDAVGRAASLLAHHGLYVVNALDHPDELLGLHQVEGHGAAHPLALGDDAPGYVPDHRRLYEAGLDAVPVQVVLLQTEVGGVLGQRVLLVQGQQAVLQGSLHGGDRCTCRVRYATGLVRPENDPAARALGVPVRPAYLVRDTQRLPCHGMDDR